MNASDAVLLIPTGIGLMAAFAFYAFAHSINHRRTVAAKEEASAPFEQDASAITDGLAGMKIFSTFSLYEAMRQATATVARASKTGKATQILTKRTTFSSARPKRAARERT